MPEMCSEERGPNIYGVYGGHTPLHKTELCDLFRYYCLRAEARRLYYLCLRFGVFPVSETLETTRNIPKSKRRKWVKVIRKISLLVL